MIVVDHRQQDDCSGVADDFPAAALPAASDLLHPDDSKSRRGEQDRFGRSFRRRRRGGCRGTIFVAQLI
jgi:hypothetical protein